MHEPKVYFMHIGGEGPVDKLAQGVRAIFDKESEIRGANAQYDRLAKTSGAPQPAEKILVLPTGCDLAGW